MKKIIIITIFLSSLFAKNIDLKMIVSAETDRDKAEQTLRLLKKFFQKDTVAKELKTKQHLELQTEELGGYFLTEIKPVRTVLLKNELQMLLQERYPHAFIVPDSKIKIHDSATKSSAKKQIKANNLKISPKNNISITEEKRVQQIAPSVSIVQGLPNEWLALILLALAGMLLVFRSARQINKIKKLQNKLEIYQEKMDNQVDYLGEQYE